ncbi:hypothetical protein DICPUDRAFT_150991 [Dictyostelium purpureum]|uniref:Phospholipase B-like n=1 Tax=Dictyostelium purpureum TaxID=5786 RepID=F0ZHR4_DICPU|nr:uncharacterized protein DICPUDRAFT_150991 [Dictyostelium purpureum]EGC36508.1 hypothetical protein DICPUDRAFT_150991 [Dictyostelium purpureum]|eukprot:XP_003286953.1 hypothetical protein DICPUDRAFT_150991 [Dictyostelium purpureum]
MRLILFLLVILFINNVLSVTPSSKVEEDPRYRIESAPEWYSISSDYKVTPGKNTNSLGWGYYKDEVSKDGWGKLYIEMNSNSNTTQSYYGAGYLEGYLTWGITWNFSQNYFNTYFNSTDPSLIPKPLIEFSKANYQYMKSEFNQQNSLFNQQVNNVIEQFEGLTQGYQDAADSDKQLTTIQLLLLNYIGDLEDVAGYLEYEMAQNKTEYVSKVKSQKEIENILATKGRCSALIKVTSDFSDLFSAHVTWGSYFTMLRIFKRVIIPDSSNQATEQLFSSYPGVLTSDDDFFILKPSDLVVIETTNDILNNTLYQYVTPNSLLYWVRSIVANRISSNSQEWTENFVQFNSGTYNNQWMIVDYKLFTPYQPLQPNTLWIVEQLPGGYYSEDVTDILALGYWPSYNRPYFPKVQEAMGYTYYSNLYGDILSYSLNPRAKIFRRDQNNVYSVDDMQSIMRYNEYKIDPFSEGYPGNAISSRYDLGGGPSQPAGWFYQGPHGGIDAKITSSSMVQNTTCTAISGPTVTSSCPVFNWTGFESVFHVGLPNVFNFDWVTMDIKSN